MNKKITNLINLGPYDDSVVYYDLEKKEFYKSNLNKNNLIIFIGVPIATFFFRVMSAFLNSFHLRLSYFSSVSILMAIALIAVLLTIHSCNHSRRKIKIEKIEMTEEGMKLLRLKSRILKIFEVLSFLSMVFTFVFYLLILDFQLLFIYIFSVVAYTYILYDYQPRKRKTIFKNYLFKEL